jgi:thiamine-monophosphate kinase
VAGPATVSECSERELIARIRQHLAPPPAWLLVGIGDDAAVAEPERNRVEVFSADAIVEGIHFDRAFVPADAIGHRALAVNLSDLAAMGAAPRLALLSMALPATLPLADFDAIARGFAALAARHTLHLVGGNLTRSPGPLMIDVTIVGTVKRRQALMRGGARPGDELYVTGTIGAAAAGLRLLQERCQFPRNGQHSTTGDTEDTEGHTSRLQDFSSVSSVSSVVKSSSVESSSPEHCIQRYLRPEPRVRMGLLLSRNRAATACMDLSDGLADAAHQVAEASGVAVTIDAAALPIDPAARAFFAARGLDPVIAAITGGDDYELLLAVRPRAHRRLAAVGRHGDAPLTRVGRCTAGDAVTLQRAADDAVPLPHGYGHFR